MPRHEETPEAREARLVREKNALLRTLVDVVLPLEAMLISGVHRTRLDPETAMRIEANVAEVRDTVVRIRPE